MAEKIRLQVRNTTNAEYPWEDVGIDAAGISVPVGGSDLSGILLAVEAMEISLGSLDNSVDGNYLNVNANIAGTDFVGGAGAVAAGVQRVTLASDDPAVVDLAAIEALLITVDADTSTLAGAVAAGQMQVDIVADGAGLATSAKQLADGHNVTIDNISSNEVFIRGGGTAGSPTDGEVVVIQGIAGADAVIVSATNLDIRDIDKAQDDILIYANTVKDGSGTSYVPLVDSDGNLQIDVLSIIPGTGATNLGKAIDDAVGATDTGIAILAKHNSNPVHLTTDEGDYDALTLSDFGALETEPEQHYTFDQLDATTGWSALGNDTLNLATTKKHITGTDALTFDKVDGDANTVFAGIQKTISSVDLGAPSPHDIISTVVYLSNVTDVNYVFVRVGTNSSNYNEWRITGDDLTGGEFLTLVFNLGDASHTGITGNGWNPGAITYIVVGVGFNAETNTLSGIIFDELSFHTNQHVSSEINAEVSTSISSPNVNIKKWGAKNVTNAAALADNTSTPTARHMGAFGMWYDGSNWDRARGTSADGLLVNLGTNNDVTLATLPDTAPGDLAAMVVDLAAIEVLLGTIDADTGAIKIATEKLDDITGAIKGPGEPAVDSFTQFAIDLNAGADQVLVSSAANKQIWVYSVAYTCSVAGTVSFQDEDDTAITGIMDHAANSGLGISPSGNFSMPIWKLGTDKDLEVDVVTAAIDGWISYAIVSV